ncbi:hypothetical protein GS831_14630, partial [Rhodococcus hoagii]|nr:hypothetical protein [Prescottella equi]
RELDVAASGADQLLVVPESTNIAWWRPRPTHRLQPVVVGGWQQGWIVPAAPTAS